MVTEPNKVKKHTKKKKILKRSSHGKLKWTNPCWKTSKSWQTRSFTCQTHVKSQRTVICNMTDLFSAVAQLEQWNSRREKKKEPESGGETEWFGRNPVCLFLVSL